MARGGGDGARSELPWRGPGPGRPDLALPPGRMPMRAGGSWLKQWRYAAAFGEELMLCGASVQVGPFGQSFWAVLERGGELLERTRPRLPVVRGEVWTEVGAGEPWRLGGDHPRLVTRIESGELTAKLTFGEGSWAESVCPTPAGSHVWTRKRTGPVRCELTLPGGRRIDAELEGVEDESAGYHPRHTVWHWSAGVGRARDGRALGWNLVEGVNDPPERSERAIWVDGEPYEPGPVSFDGLESVAFASGARLAFAKEAERAREERMLLLRSRYRQPFGSFSGSLDGIELESGLGVMEFHEAHW